MKQKILSQAWELFCQIDATAVHHKRERIKWEITTMVLAGLSALLICLSQVSLFSGIKVGLSLFSAIFTTLSASIISNTLHARGSKSWQSIRGVAEDLKSELYIFCTSSGRYAGLSEEEQSNMLHDKKNKAHELVDDIELLPANDNVPPPVDLSVQDYALHRVKDQIHWYKNKAVRYEKLLGRFRFFLQTLAVLVAGLGALSVYFNNRMWIAFMTTVISAISSYLLSVKYSELKRSYLILHKQAARLDHDFHENRIDAGKYVERAEGLFRNENQSWVSIW